MARTIEEIQQGMINTIQGDDTLSGLNSTSKTALWRLFTYVIAVCAWTVEILFDTLKNEINDLLAKLKPHTARWYEQKALAFQLGFNLLPDSDQYDNSAFTTDQIEASKIIKYCAVIVLDRSLRIKVATVSGDLIPLSNAQLNAFKEYMKRVKDAGVKLSVESLPADRLKLTLSIYYDPLILNSEGQRLDGTDSEPVQKIVKNYLKNLPFSGTFVLAYLVDVIQKVDGVVIPHVTECLASFGAFPYSSVNVSYVPDAGYLRFVSDADLQINFIAQSQIQ